MIDFFDKDLSVIYNIYTLWSITRQLVKYKKKSKMAVFEHF